MRKGSMTTERCHAVPAKGRNRTAQIENLGRATRGPVGTCAKRKANRKSQPKRVMGTVVPVTTIEVAGLRPTSQGVKEKSLFHLLADFVFRAV